MLKEYGDKIEGNLGTGGWWLAISITCSGVYWRQRKGFLLFILKQSLFFKVAFSNSEIQITHSSEGSIFF